MILLGMLVREVPWHRGLHQVCCKGKEYALDTSLPDRGAQVYLNPKMYSISDNYG